MDPDRPHAVQADTLSVVKLWRHMGQASEPREPPSRVKRERATAAKAERGELKRITRLPAEALAKVGGSV
jgi:hypothetical protein